MGKWGVGMPRKLMLDEFASLVWDAFGDCPYLVGSALDTTDWRDVDVRLLGEAIGDARRGARLDALVLDLGAGGAPVLERGKGAERAGADDGRAARQERDRGEQRR